MQKITPFLWFDGNAGEAINFYTTVFKDSQVGEIVNYNEGGPGKPGSVMTGTFYLQGQQFMAINGGPMFKFTEAISFFVNCETQDEVDYYWEVLSADGGNKSRCGWLKDKFGVSWQIVPSILSQLLHSPDAQQANRVMTAMMKMDKLDIKTLQEAAGN
ncbi:Glyoxalase superfamily enzyme, possibly 3-demethylubiquinone-9 3-methyltransferase [Mucilaginibacter pineti]|uniref:Glyoxalase superfamily enzyme, possibly 3-demethylubiquinone-9 3-methyltransferase n=1 Tax=Mucilaginibacter pineti TaxID=1391627 RepID=A0A1G6UHU9_9SPHI|nr:VOC family protein [Mucilaginibacter pineti]SDD40157.1 Glyoxalase superfamily enzyme, possibly 3-demethylubiquinone-9 3-methyltransferase [Mucilaginibacter pineti]